MAAESFFIHRARTIMVRPDMPDRALQGIDLAHMQHGSRLLAMKRAAGYSEKRIKDTTYEFGWFAQDDAHIPPVPHVMWCRIPYTRSPRSQIRWKRAFYKVHDGR